MTHEITHAKMSMKALDAMGKLDDPMFGTIPPDDTVKLVFNLSQGEDARSPWNEEPDFGYIADPTPMGGMPPAPINPDDQRPASAKAKGENPVGYRSFVVNFKSRCWNTFSAGFFKIRKSS